MKFAQILNNKVHCIYDVEKKPVFSDKITLIDISSIIPQPQEGWNYNDGEFSKPDNTAIILAAIRQARNEKLADSDWTQIPDNSLSDSRREEWRAYRQSLRDLPKSIDDVGDFNWPVPPAQ